MDKTMENDTEIATYSSIYVIYGLSGFVFIGFRGSLCGCPFRKSIQCSAAYAP